MQKASAVTAADIASRYLGGEATPERLQKAKALAHRSKVLWSAVQAIIDRSADA